MKTHQSWLCGDGAVHTVSPNEASQMETFSRTNSCQIDCVHAADTLCANTISANEHWHPRFTRRVAYFYISGGAVACASVVKSIVLQLT